MGLQSYRMNHLDAPKGQAEFRSLTTAGDRQKLSTDINRRLYPGRGPDDGDTIRSGGWVLARSQLLEPDLEDLAGRSDREFRLDEDFGRTFVRREVLVCPLRQRANIERLARQRLNEGHDLLIAGNVAADDGDRRDAGEKRDH